MNQDFGLLRWHPASGFSLRCTCATHLTLGAPPDMQNWNIAVTAFSKKPLLDTIPTPDDLRRLKAGQRRQVPDGLRHETIGTDSVNAGHFGEGLGVVELTA